MNYHIQLKAKNKIIQKHNSKKTTMNVNHKNLFTQLTNSYELIRFELDALPNHSLSELQGNATTAALESLQVAI